MEMVSTEIQQCVMASRTIHAAHITSHGFHRRDKHKRAGRRITASSPIPHLAHINHTCGSNGPQVVRTRPASGLRVPHARQAKVGPRARGWGADGRSAPGVVGGLVYLASSTRAATVMPFSS